MRFLVDEDVDVRVIRVLKRLGHEAQRVPPGATNGTVIQLARRAGRVLLTRDSDFTNIALYPPPNYTVSFTSRSTHRGSRRSPLP